MAKENATTADATPTPKKRGKLILILALAGVLLAGGGLAAFWYTRPAAPESTEAEHEAPEPESSGIVGFEPFVVNLADPGGGRFLRISVQLVIVDEEAAGHIQEDDVQMLRLRSALIELLAEQTSAELVTSEGKLALKAAIVDRASDMLQPATVSDVLFSDFIVQF